MAGLFDSAVAGVRKNFFDRAGVIAATDRMERRGLSKFGAFVRTRDTRSQRKRKKASLPGQPPSVHLGLVKKFTYFAYDPRRKSVVIGPVPLTGRRPTTLRTLEEGGRVDGRGRVVFVNRPPGRDARGKFVAAGKVRVEVHGSINYRPRPHTGPAFRAELPNAPAMLRGEFKKGK